MRILIRFFASRLALVSALAAFALAFVSSAPARAQFVEFGDTIVTPGVYFLHGNQSGSGTGVTIASDDVTLVLGRFSLRGDGTGDGIVVDGHRYVTIWGGRIKDFRQGIDLDGGRNVTVKDTNISYCDDGINAANVDYSDFLRVQTHHNSGNGFTVEGGDYCRFISIVSDYNDGDGMRFDYHAGVENGADVNFVHGCSTSSNGGIGLHLLEARQNKLKGNQCHFNSRAGILLDALGMGGGDAPGADENEIEKNWCNFNGAGIRVEDGAENNTLHENIALANIVDLYDDNDGVLCANTWILNFAITRGGADAACIF